MIGNHVLLSCEIPTLFGLVPDRLSERDSCCKISQVLIFSFIRLNDTEVRLAVSQLHYKLTSSMQGTLPIALPMSSLILNDQV